ncbi:MAG: 4'-phosphopantetheinyl transferase superfamily protein [Pseudomonadota bacterium]
MAQPDTLTAGDVHVWLAEPEAFLVSLESVDQALALLDADEQRRYHAFRFDRDRRVFLAAHLLLRTRLSLYAPVAPGAWTFEKNAFGRPEVAGGLLEADGLRFNLSHTNGLVACAITRSADVGIDVESLSRPTPGLDIAERFFSPDEFAMLQKAPADEQHQLFFAIWTLKEAYIKARGMGLSLPLDQFAFDIDGLAVRGVRFRDEIKDNPKNWRFGVQSAGHQHLLAFAVRREDGGNIQPVIHQA